MEDFLRSRPIRKPFFVDKNGNITGETYSGARSLEEWEEIINTELENLEAAQETE